MNDKRLWKNVPLILVIVEVQFDDNDAIEDVSAKVQREFSEFGFVGTQTHEIRHANIVLGESEITPTYEPMKLQQIFNAKATQVFSISRRQLLFVQSDYSNFEILKETVERGIKIISEYTQLNKPIRRLGLRYIDLLEEQKDLTIKQQVNAALLGFNISEQDGSEVLSTSSDGQSRLVFKAITGVTLIPHLQQSIGPIPSVPRLSTPIQVKNSLVIDIDVAQEWNINTPNRPLMTEISGMLETFHHKASKVFNTSLTQDAFEHYRGW